MRKNRREGLLKWRFWNHTRIFISLAPCALNLFLISFLFFGSWLIVFEPYKNTTTTIKQILYSQIYIFLTFWILQLWCIWFVMILFKKLKIIDLSPLLQSQYCLTLYFKKTADVVKFATALLANRYLYVFHHTEWQSIPYKCITQMCNDHVDDLHWSIDELHRNK